ncbi:MAG: RDD family protein [Aerococcus sp.]|nr:RDD family protein [Aerococcus sp.]
MTDDKKQTGADAHFDQLNVDQPLYQGTLEEAGRQANHIEKNTPPFLDEGVTSTKNEVGEDASHQPNITSTSDSPEETLTDQENTATADYSMKDEAAIAHAEETDHRFKSVVRPVHMKEADETTFQHASRNDGTDHNRSDQTVHWTDYPRAVFAGFWVRLFAYVVDMLVIWGLGHLIPALLDAFSLNLSLTTAMGEIFDYVVAMLYFTLFAYFTNGYTVGKALFHLRTVQMDGQPLSLMTSFAREGIGKMLLMKLPILGLMVVFTPYRKNFMDFFTETSVVNEHFLKAVEDIQATVGWNNAHYSED